MRRLKIKILKFHNETQPGWVKCSFVDKNKIEHFFIEKIPVIALDIEN